MNLSQFLLRWPSKEKRLYFIAGGKDADRLPVFYTVGDYWRSRVDSMDFVRLHEPSLQKVAETCRMDPINSKYRVVCATEVQWPLDETPSHEIKKNNDRQREALNKLIQNMPRDLVLIMSSATPNPLTDHDLAQVIIRKGYWVVLKATDETTASNLLAYLTQWDVDLCYEVVQIHGTSPAALLSLARTIRLAFDKPSEDQIRKFVGNSSKGHVFEITEAIVQKDLARALRLSARDNVPAAQLIGALDRKLTTVLCFMAEMKKGRSPREAIASLRMPGFLAHGLFEASKRWTSRDLIVVWSILAERATEAEKPGGVDLLIAEILT